MSALRILILCISAAMVCAALRMSHPQIATAVALGAGIAALMLSTEDIGVFSQAIRKLDAYIQADRGQLNLLKICGIAIIAEFASDICRDSGEIALAHRIDAGVKIGVVAASLPTALGIMERIGEILS